MKNERCIKVYAGWYENDRLIGSLYRDSNGLNDNYSFEYDDKWLAGHSNVLLDPDLLPFRGRQFTKPGKSFFGFLSDAAPDRWGRLLMHRREAIIAKKEERQPDRFSEADYLLGVHDEGRQGGIRLKLSEDGVFEADTKELAAPPWTELRLLQDSANAFEKNDDSGKWIKQLIFPGSSLGGARPKANVKAPDGSLWIAKFPSKHDESDVGAWEMVVHELGKMCGLNVPDAKLERFSDIGSTFLVKRFDRKYSAGEERRVHFASAMTMLGKTDGDSAGYPDIAGFIKANGASPDKDLKELWMRIVFYIAVSNTDDHLRNHGFLLHEDGWHLSPMYDVNPVYYGTNLSLNISSESSLKSFETALETCGYYGLDPEDAGDIADKIKDCVGGNWRKLAKEFGISRGEQKMMEGAFLSDSI